MDTADLNTENFYTYSETTGNILVEAQPFYLDERSIPEQEHFFFAYKIKVTNLGANSCSLMRRHWLIRNGRGAQREVEGAGVVGKQPEILPGESFSYTSFCPLNTPTGNMRGNFLFEDKVGNKFSATVPVFFLRLPDSFKH